MTIHFNQPMMNNIQEATFADLPQLALLFGRYRAFYKMEADAEKEKQFLSERIQNKESVIFVCYDETKQMAGFVQLYPIFSSTRMKRLWLLNDLFVNPDARSSGIGLALIYKAKELCRQTGACGLILETAVDNSPANALYLKTGFTADKEHNYYSWNFSG